MRVLSEVEFEAVNRVVEHLRCHPEDLNRNEFRELREYMASLGASIPPPLETPDVSGVKKETKSDDEEEYVSEPDSQRCVLEPVADDDIAAYDGTDSTPEDEERAMGLKAQAAELAANGDFDKAIELMGQALRIVPGKAMYWAQRASYFLKCTQPGAALQDANRALDLNPENVRALRVRGTVNRRLGKWEEALKDLSEAQAVDYDEGIDEILRFVQKRTNDRRQFQQRKKEAQRLRQEALRRQREQELREEEMKRDQQQSGAGGFPGGAGGFPGGAGGFPGGAGGGGMQSFMESLFQDQELAEAMKDPEVAAKLGTLRSNPMTALQMMGDPKVGPLIQKMMSKAMGGSSPGSSPFGAGGSAGATSHAGAHQSDELD
ncbi:Hsc70-interacting protein, putative [Trypanosoma cruzi marinkellei]|uniref:Hsc70-interacting protein, putative n=1 Tax=Trypanosoma cruzi marinkellei TaxID=85056 RepID=K2N586_TRYCR|nr:Hsc70-interacting protein, putative [Trypanosoma cruzi marinkellei]